MKKLLSIILSITMLLSMGTVSFADGVDGPMQPAKIKVGISADFPPFEYYDENGELYGFDIDLMNYIGERIGFEIEYVDMSFDKLIPAIVSGEVACAISAISITEERNNVIDYTFPYLSAKVTHIDNETSDTSIEQYAIVFPNNSAEKGKLTEAAGEPETSLYNLVNNAISDLIEDKTIEKLGEKYELNKAADTEDFDYEYTVIAVPDDFDKSNMDKSELSSGGQTSGTSVPYSDWAKSDIEKAIALNIINVGGNYNFPGAITREMFCELAYNYVSEFGKLPVDDGHIVFVDTDNMKVRILNTMGIIKGKSATQFAPNDLLTREEAATILNRLINVVHPDLASTELYYEFADSAQISDWAMSAIQRICNIGIMKGVGNNNFAPQENYTTEQAIVTLVRVYANSGVSKNVISENILYRNEKMNVQFEIPMYWQGKYFVDESVEDYIILRHTAIAEKYEGAGAICTIYKEPDETVDKTLNMLGNQTVVWQNQDYAYIVGRPTDVQHPIWKDSDEEDATLAFEYEKMAEGITHIESTFELINDVDTPVVVNAENMSYAQLRDLQRQVDNGHFPWRIDYEQVVVSFLSGKGIDVEGGEISELAGGGSSGGISLTYSIQGKEYVIELFQPIDTSEHGIWIVRTCEER